MSRVLLTACMLLLVGNIAFPNVDEYPPLTRETLVGTWEALIGSGKHAAVFHIVIRPLDSDSYLSEVSPDSVKGRLFRLDSCTITAGSVTLYFRNVSGDGGTWWIEGEGFSDSNEGWIDARISTPNKPEPGPPTSHFAKGTWVRDVGEASIRAAEKIPNK